VIIIYLLIKKFQVLIQFYTLLYLVFGLLPLLRGLEMTYKCVRKIEAHSV